MARHIRDQAPDVWSSLMPMVDKADVTARVLSGKPHCLTEYHMGRPTARPVIGCGQSNDNPTMLGVFDLSRDPTGVIDRLRELGTRNQKTRSIFAIRQSRV